MAGFSLGFGSCYQPHAPVRLDSLVIKTKAFYMLGDLAYMDGSMGSPSGLGGPAELINGDSCEGQVFNDTAAGAVITVGAAISFNGVAGQLPLGAATVTNGGTGYPVSQTFTANLSGQGGSGAVVTCTVNGSGVITAATVLAPGRGYGNAGSAAFSLVNMNWTSGYWQRRLDQVMRTPAWNDLQLARAAGYKAYFIPDDHERSNNWDFSTGQAPTGATTLVKVLDWWRTSNVGMAYVMSTYWDNQPGGGRGDIPANMVGITGAAGLVSATDFPWYPLEHDYDQLGGLITNGTTPTIRVLVLDCISGKHPQTAADNASKKMIGDVQLAWLQARCLDATARGVRHIWVLSGKDLFNLDNQDGWGATAGGGNFPYSTQRDAILAWGQANSVPWIWVCGDRHCAHAAMRSVAQGDAYDVTAVCPTPFGSKNGTTATLTIGNTPYPEMVWQHRKRDQLVHGLLTWDADNQQSVISIVDNCDDTEQFAVMVPAGARVPASWNGFRQLRQP